MINRPICFFLYINHFVFASQIIKQHEITWGAGLCEALAFKFRFFNSVFHGGSLLTVDVDSLVDDDEWSAVAGRGGGWSGMAGRVGGWVCVGDFCADVAPSSVGFGTGALGGFVAGVLSGIVARGV